MDEIIKSAVSQVPALAVLAIIVQLFLKRMKESDTLITAIHNDSIDARRNSQDVIAKNSLVVGENTSACREMTATMHELMRRTK